MSAAEFAAQLRKALDALVCDGKEMAWILNYRDQRFESLRSFIGLHAIGRGNSGVSKEARCLAKHQAV
jgi:hypothetical protein